MIARGITLSFAALIAAGALAGAAKADQRRLPPPPPPEFYEDDYYTGPPVIRHIPGLRILFGDYAMSEEEFDQLYNERQNERMRRKFDERYYEPEPAPPKAKRITPPKKPATTTAKPATPGQPQQKTAAAAKPASSSSGALTCEKATSVISGYGFSSVEASSCAGKTYAFNATRDGKKFAIKLDPANGELTEVKKLP